MTVIRPNSISGITSITAQANEINVFRSNGLIAGLNLNGVNFNTTAGISTLAALKVTGNVDVAGVLTYQDVTNVDSLGIGTFRTGINVSGGQLDVGSNIKLGNAGVITATSFSGSGANLTSLPVPTTITVADESSDTTCNPLFVTTTTGNLAPKTGTNLVFNSSSGNLRTGSLFLGIATNESKTQDGLILERNSGDGEVHITAGRSGGNYSGLQFYVAGGSGVTKRHQIDYAGNFRWYGADGTSERLRIDSNGKFCFGTYTNGYQNNDSVANFVNAASSGTENPLITLWNPTTVADARAGIDFLTNAQSGSGRDGAFIRGSNDGVTAKAHLQFGTILNETYAETFRIHSTGQVTKPASCAFNVTPNGNQSLGNGETLTSWKTTDSRGFENTTTGGYFGSGIFTAPVTGAYYFTSNILLYDTNGTNSIHLYWQKNGSGTHTYWNTRFNSGDFGYGNYMPVAGACTMYMSAGDTCRIRISFSGSNCGMYGNDQNWGNWGGFLIG